MEIFHRSKYTLETSLLGLADGLDAESKRKKEIKISMLLYLRYWLDVSFIAKEKT